MSLCLLSATILHIISSSLLMAITAFVFHGGHKQNRQVFLTHTEVN